MTFVSTRKGLTATGPETVFQGLAPDGGLYVPESLAPLAGAASVTTLREAETLVMDALFDDFAPAVRAAAIERLLSRFPKEDPIPVTRHGAFHFLELFHGSTGAFKDVALSMLPVLMKAAAGDSRVLVLTATSGDTGSAAMQGFAGVEGTEILVFYPATGISRVQRLQMTTPGAANVHAVGIHGNFDDAQSAVKRFFADERLHAHARERGVFLSSANSINTGRLVPQIAYFLLAAARVGEPIDVVVPSGNFGNMLAAYYAKKLGANIRSFVVASNVNDVLARFVRTGVYAPEGQLIVTNSPSMDILKSSNVERLLHVLNDGDADEVSRLMDDFARTGRYALKPAARERLAAEFVGGVATPEETLAEMRRTRDETGAILDPHTAVASAVARKLGFPRAGGACVIAATATPYKFPETCLAAFGEDVLTSPPESFRALDALPIAQTRTCDVDQMENEVTRLFGG